MNNDLVPQNGGVLAGIGMGLAAAAPISLWLLARLNRATRRAYRDPLTRLPNRDAAETHHARTSTAGRSLTVMLLDLDRFKCVNDDFGHEAGDRILQAVAARLADQARRVGGLAARLAGDEFVMLVPAGATADHESQVQAIRHAIARPVTVPGHHRDHILTPSGTVGVAMPQSRFDRWSTLLRAADVALYHAKRGRQPWALHTEDLRVPPKTRADGPTIRRPRCDRMRSVPTALHGHATAHWGPCGRDSVTTGT